MLVVLLIVFVLRQRRWGEVSSKYRTTPSRPFELSSNRSDVCRCIVQCQLVPAKDDLNAIYPVPLEPSQSRLKLTKEGHDCSDGSLRPAICVVQLRRARVGELEQLGDAGECDLLQGLCLGRGIGRSGVYEREMRHGVKGRGTAVYFGLRELARARCHRETVWEVERMGRGVRREVDQERCSVCSVRYYTCVVGCIEQIGLGGFDQPGGDACR